MPTYCPHCFHVFIFCNDYTISIGVYDNRVQASDSEVFRDGEPYDWIHFKHRVGKVGLPL